MAIKLQHAPDQYSETHEINVVPFLDIVLVLLIVFMVAAPLATVDMTVDLPPSVAEQPPRPDQPIFLTIRPDRSLAIGEDPILRDELSAALRIATYGNREERIFVNADRAVSYGDLMELMNALRAEGYLKVALVGLDGRGRR